MRGGKLVVPVFEDHGYVEGIARPPYAPFSVDEGFQALVEDLPSDIETAELLFIAFSYLQVAGGSAPFGDHDERFG